VLIILHTLGYTAICSRSSKHSGNSYPEVGIIDQIVHNDLPPTVDNDGIQRKNNIIKLTILILYLFSKKVNGKNVKSVTMDE